MWVGEKVRMGLQIVHRSSKVYTDAVRLHSDTVVMAAARESKQATTLSHEYVEKNDHLATGLIVVCVQ